MTFREKLAAAMVGHDMAEIADVLVDALGAVMHEADPAIRGHAVEEACAKIARTASQR